MITFEYPDPKWPFYIDDRHLLTQRRPFGKSLHVGCYPLLNTARGNPIDGGSSWFMVHLYYILLTYHYMRYSLYNL